MDQNQENTTQIPSSPESLVSIQSSPKLGFPIKLAVFGVILVLLVSFGAFLMGRKTGNNLPVSTTSPSIQQPEPTSTKHPEFYSARCEITIFYPQGWKAQETALVPGKDNLYKDYGCMDILAPDYKEGLSSREGFFMNITRTKLGTDGNKITIATLEDYIHSVENTSDPITPVKNNSQITYGILSGRQYDASFFETLTNFIFIKNGYIYDVYWPTNYTGEYKNQVKVIISSILFPGKRVLTIPKSFTSEKIGFSMKYPSEVTQSEKDGYITFTQWGPTQKDQTEFYDSINILIKSGSLNGQTLTDYVNKEVENSKQNGDILEYPKTVILAGVSGLQYKARGLGSFTYYYVPLKNDNFLQIIDGTNDPTNLGFAKTVEVMLSTLELTN